MIGPSNVKCTALWSQSYEGAVNEKDRGQGKIERSGRAFRSSASRNGLFGLCQPESFGNSIADSVSFRLPSWQSLDGHPVPPAISAPGYATPRERPQQHKKKRTGRLQARPLNASPYSVPYCFTAQCDGDGYFVRNECNSPLARRAPWPLSHWPSTLACFSLQRVHWSILDCACSASGRISRLPSPTGRRWREILNRGQNARKASVSGIGGKTRRVPQAARTSDVVRSTTLRSC